MPSEPSGQVPGLARQLAADWVVRATGVVLIGITLPYLIPIVGPARLVALSEGPFFIPLAALVVVATLVGVRRIENAAEQRFWTFFGASFSCWLASLILTELPNWTNADPVLVFTYEALVFGLYTTAILATTQAPHLPRAERPDAMDRSIVLAGTLCFGLAMWTYFDVVPFLLDRAAFESRLPSFYLYLALDATLVWRLGFLLLAAGTRRWRTLYGLILATALLLAAGDLLDALRIAEIFVYRSGTAWDFLWYLLFVPILLAGRISRAAVAAPPDPDGPELEGRAAADPGSPLLALALLLPLVHFGLSSLDLLSGRAHRAREGVAMVGMVVVLGLARWHQHRLERANRALQRELDGARERLAAARQQEAIGRLAGGIAHDFNNLLFVVLGHGELLVHDKEHPDEVAAHAEAIQIATRRAAELTSELLAVGRKQLLLRRPLDLDQLIRSLGPELRAAAGNSTLLELRPAVETPTTRVDPGGIRQALLHLVANAREAMPNGGTLTLQTCVAQLATAELSAAAPSGTGRYVVLDLQDSGSGMSEEVLALAFEPFFTTKRVGEGSGLGLSTVEGIVEQSGGFVTIDSEPGRGTRVRLHFPWTSERPDSIPQASA